MSRASFLGLVPGTRQGVGVSLDARVRGTYVVGITGAGKSSLLLGLMCQNMRAGEGFLLLDPAGDLGNDVIARAAGFGRQDDILLLDLQARTVAFGLNLFACPDPTDAQLVAATAERAVAVFKKVWGEESWGPRMEDLLANAALTLVANPGATLADLPPLLTEPTVRARLVRRLDNPVVQAFWEREYNLLSEGQRQQVCAPLLNKVRAFLRDPLLAAIVAQPANSVDLGQAIAQRKIVLVRLDGDLPEATNLLGTAIIQQFTGAAFARRALPPHARHPYFLYADEAQRFATPGFITLLREARKFGVATTAATQVHTLLPPDVATGFTNAATVVCFQLVPEDARALQGLFTGRAIPTPRLLEPDPLGTILRGHPDPTLVTLALQVQSALGAYQVAREEHHRYQRELGLDSPLVASHLRQARALLDAFLYAAQRGRAASPAWDELRRVVSDPAVLAPVWRLGAHLAEAPLSRRPADTLSVAQALTRLPAFHALVRSREGTVVTEAFVRTLVTRPLRRPQPVRPLGRPRGAVLAALAGGRADDAAGEEMPLPVSPSQARPLVTAEVDLDG